jgi:hypothetical protein
MWSDQEPGHDGLPRSRIVFGGLVLAAATLQIVRRDVFQPRLAPVHLVAQLGVIALTWVSHQASKPDTLIGKHDSKRELG